MQISQVIHLTNSKNWLTSKTVESRVFLHPAFSVYQGDNELRYLPLFYKDLSER